MTVSGLVSVMATGLILSLSTTAPGARSDGLLSAHILHHPSQRSFGPVPVNMTLEWKGSAFLNGRLELQIRDGQALVMVYRTSPLVLSQGDNNLHVVLPSVVLQANRFADVSMRFLTESGAIDLGADQLSLPMLWQQNLVIGVSDPWGSLPPRLGRFVQSLRFERFNPNADSRDISTMAISLKTETMPKHPLGYFSYDVVVLAGEGFGSLEVEQLDALARWVHAGGSLCADVRTTLDQRHLDFLNRLIGSHREELHFGLDATGEVRSLGMTSGDGIVRVHAELGRVVVVTQPFDASSIRSGEPWRQARAFLWKVRSEHMAALIENGKWSDDWSGESSQRRAATAGLAELVAKLLPSNVRVVPVRTVVLILVLFVFAIGPVDYFLLGLIHRRRWTWVVLPATTLAFTWFTIDLSNRHMGQTDQRTTAIVVDVGRGGQVLRQTRFELRFSAGRRNYTAQPRWSIFTPIDDASMAIRYQSRGTRIEPSLIEGNFPAAFSVRQTLAKWTPHLTRITRFGQAADGLDADWDSIDAAMLWMANPVEIKQKLLGDRPFEGSILLFHHGSGDSPQPLDVEWKPPHVLYGRSDPFSTRGLRRGSRWHHGEPVNFLTNICVRPREQFDLVSQLSPTGGSHLDDLAVLDPSDPKQWLLVVVEEKGEDIWVYRRLYRGE